jgi:hypothetical protein
MRIDSSGNVGIGTSSPSEMLDVFGNVRIGGAGNLETDTKLYVANTGGNAYLQIKGADSTGTVGIKFGRNSNAVQSGMDWNASDGALKFYTSNFTERMRIDSSGRLLLGASSIGAGMNGTFFIETDAATRNLIDANNTAAGTASSAFIAFRRNGTFTGGISNTGTSTAYNTSSDYRLKENVNYDFDATTRLKQLKPARFNFIADDTKIVDGFIAHEVSSVVPEAISGEKDALQVWQEGEKLPEGVSVGDNKLDADGNTIIEAQGIDQSKLVPLLVKTIQELEARITALETQP